MKNNEERCYVVYKHTSPNNKVYIGITCQNPPEKRWQNGTGYRFNKHFDNAISKYGWQNFLHEILFESLTKEEAEQKEIELISYYDSTNHDKGYNISYGGSSVGKHNEESKHKMSESHINISAVPIVKYSKDGEYLKRYNSLSEASKENGLFKTAISACCKGAVKTAGDFIWQYESQPLTKEHIEWCNKNDLDDRKISVDQYTIFGELIKTYNSIRDASYEVGVSVSSISKCCKGIQRTAFGCIWRYTDDKLTKEYLNWCNNSGNEDRKISVMQYSTDGKLIRIFDSITAVENELGFNKSAITRTCKGKQKTSYGYIWRYADDENNEFRQAV